MFIQIQVGRGSKEWRQWKCSRTIVASLAFSNLSTFPFSRSFSATLWPESWLTPDSLILSTKTSSQKLGRHASHWVRSVWKKFGLGKILVEKVCAQNILFKWIKYFQKKKCFFFFHKLFWPKAYSAQTLFQTECTRSSACLPSFCELVLSVFIFLSVVISF